MVKAHMGLAAAGLLLGLLGWDNWQVREELAQQKRENAAQASALAARPAPAPPPPAPECPKSALAAAPDKVVPSGVSSTPDAPARNPTVVMPPGTDLREALLIIQREQARQQAPATSTVSPFGASP